MPHSFPGFTLKRNSPHTEAVREIQLRLAALGCGPVEANGLFGKETESAVRMFQGRFPDRSGAALKVDGEVGPVSWAALFGAGSLEPTGKGSALAEAALRVAGEEIGVVEDPAGSNRGRKVEEFLASVGVAPGNAWCASFVYWCVGHAAKQLGQPNCLPRTGGVMELWRRSRSQGLPCLKPAEILAQPVLVRSGMVFIMDHGGGKGHTGFVETLENGRLVTIEGNSSDSGSREGTGVFRLNRRTLGTINGGFIGLP